MLSNGVGEAAGHPVPDSLELRIRATAPGGRDAIKGAERITQGRSA